ncbi:hypothetical protein ACFL6U_14300 [Planctomycetota bacterium]
MLKSIIAWLSNKPYTKAQYITAFASIGAVVISVGAFATSAWSVRNSTEANRIASKALEVSQTSFHLESNPFTLLVALVVSHTTSFDE